jgi:hypothetical protein
MNAVFVSAAGNQPCAPRFISRPTPTSPCGDPADRNPRVGFALVRRRCARLTKRRGPCALYPIGLSLDALRDVTPGAILDDIFEGAAPGQFGWLSWSGSPSEVLLAQSLEPPGNSQTYVNPEDSRDHGDLARRLGGRQTRGLEQPRRAPRP